MDMERVLADFGENMNGLTVKTGRVKSKITQKQTNFKVTEVYLEIQKKGEDFARSAWVTIMENADGDKRFSVMGEHDLEVWADIMKYLKSV